MKISTANISKHMNRFEKAVRAHEMKGAQHPDDWKAIEVEYLKAKANLKQFMIECVIGAGP